MAALLTTAFGHAADGEKKDQAGGTHFVFGTNQLTDDDIRATQKLLFGIAHRHQLQPEDPRPNDAVKLTITIGPGLNARDAWCYYTVDGSDPAGAKGVAKRGQAIPFKPVAVEWADLVWGYLTRFEAVIPGQVNDTLVRYIIECDGQYANGGEARHGDTAHSPYFAYAVDEWKTPEWVRDATMYYIMPDRFYPGDGRTWIQTEDNSRLMGGTLRGVRDKLDYIQRMGFDCIWLMPWSTAPSYHKYDATDFRAIDPGLGTEEDLRALIEEAHRRGMRVLVDFVGNHCSNQHPFFKEALSDPASPYRHWFQFNPDGTYKAFFGGNDVPHLVNENPDTRRYLIDLAIYWLREFGVDGFDLDYSIGLSYEFWATFGREVRKAKPDVVLFTEGVTNPAVLRHYVGRVDGCQDFTWNYIARLAYGSGQATVEDFERVAEGADAFFPAGFVAPVMLDNQNMDRFLVVAHGNQHRLRIAGACLYSTSRPISMWAGTEMGMGQRKTVAEWNLHATRDATAWENADKDTLEYFRRLGELRANHVSLRRGARRLLQAEAATGILVYEKTADTDRCVVLINASKESRNVTLPELKNCRDLLGGLAVETNSVGGSITLPPLSAAYLFSAP